MTNVESMDRTPITLNQFDAALKRILAYKPKRDRKPRVHRTSAKMTAPQILRAKPSGRRK